MLSDGDVISSVYGMSGVPVIIAVTEGIKRAFPTLSDRWYPLVAWAIALVINLAIAYSRHTDLGVALVSGLLAGLAASGLYSGGRTLTAK